MYAWCFALINGKLTEVHFEKAGNQPKILGHCSVKLKDYNSKKEQKYIKKDTTKFQFTYKNKKYQRAQT